MPCTPIVMCAVPVPVSTWQSVARYLPMPDHVIHSDAFATPNGCMLGGGVAWWCGAAWALHINELGRPYLATAGRALYLTNSKEAPIRNTATKHPQYSVGKTTHDTRHTTHSAHAAWSEAARQAWHSYFPIGLDVALLHDATNHVYALVDGGPLWYMHWSKRCSLSGVSPSQVLKSISLTVPLAAKYIPDIAMNGPFA